MNPSGYIMFPAKLQRMISFLYLGPQIKKEPFLPSKEQIISCKRLLLLLPYFEAKVINHSTQCTTLSWSSLKACQNISSNSSKCPGKFDKLRGAKPISISASVGLSRSLNSNVISSLISSLKASYFKLFPKVSSHIWLITTFLSCSFIS